jgi:hypothetical protein
MFNFIPTPINMPSPRKAVILMLPLVSGLLGFCASDGDSDAAFIGVGVGTVLLFIYSCMPDRRAITPPIAPTAHIQQPLGIVIVPDNLPNYTVLGG